MDKELIDKICNACRFNNLGHLVKILGSHPIEESIVDDEGDTPLGIAIEKGCQTVASCLIKRNISINDPIGANRYSPLHMCILTAYPREGRKIAKELIKKGVDINARCLGKYTPLHFACILKDRLEDARTLLKHGADINATTDKGDNPLHCSLLIHAQIDLVEFLVSKGADLNHKNNGGYTPLELAKHYGHFKIVKYLGGLHG